ncbi:AraC family transcriptional regulator [Amphibacillus sp. MSJ-3]|uniref:AraC family transcriptional regulator n=1 Tax=Amphibacillus sp. MSJ-3 TaxID=2841505 RepID=UPI001C0E96CB|nr:AraC family transcriptional regulator [Amphibacillus sp. MSJ-3]MBU5593779.1 AraC family transcriptional regulator [Amphibacillus sp. MSJ-3]
MAKKLNVSFRKKPFYIDYKMGTCSRDSMRNFHLHSDYEIYYLIEGERKYLINDEQYLIRENDLIFIDRNVMHKTETAELPSFQRVVINFQDNFLCCDDHFLLAELFENGPHIISVPACKKKIISELIIRMQNEYIDDRKDAMHYIRTLLTQLLLESNRLLKREVNIPIVENDNDTLKQEVVADIIKYINTHYSNDISLTLLSQKFHLNEQYISRLFKDVTGNNIINYLNAVRINEAQRLLIESDMKVIEISKSVGYSNNVHFWRVFKKLMGISPSEYRTVYEKAKM